MSNKKRLKRRSRVPEPLKLYLTLDENGWAAETPEPLPGYEYPFVFGSNIAGDVSVHVNMLKREWLSNPEQMLIDILALCLVAAGEID